jgi:hypothetical protein
MNEKEKGFITAMAVFFVGIICIIGVIILGVYFYHALEVKNFQTTIKDLSQEQKCLHICGFEFGGYLDGYKFCTEKCDRISERLNQCGDLK